MAKLITKISEVESVEEDFTIPLGAQIVTLGAPESDFVPVSPSPSEPIVPPYTMEVSDMSYDLSFTYPFEMMPFERTPGMLKRSLAYSAQTISWEVNVLDFNVLPRTFLPLSGSVGDEVSFESIHSVADDGTDVLDGIVDSRYRGSSVDFIGCHLAYPDVDGSDVGREYQMTGLGNISGTSYWHPITTFKATSGGSEQYFDSYNDFVGSGVGILQLSGKFWFAGLLGGITQRSTSYLYPALLFRVFAELNASSGGWHTLKSAPTGTWYRGPVIFSSTGTYWASHSV